jgi:predicted nuclease of predicted toxin-antitoxin system
MNDRPLTFVADESCDFAVVRALRSAGFDVQAIVEQNPGLPDIEILKATARQRSILLTEDKDFGEWVFAHGQSTGGIVLIRFPARMRQDMIRAVVELVSEHNEDLKDTFVVLEPGRARIRSIRSLPIRI